jgi:hypothetical protein
MVTNFFFFSALSLPLAVESGIRKIKNSRNQDELDTGCETPLALAFGRQSLFRQMDSNSLLSLLRYEFICGNKICKR